MKTHKNTGSIQNLLKSTNSANKNNLKVLKSITEFRVGAGERGGLHS